MNLSCGVADLVSTVEKKGQAEGPNTGRIQNETSRAGCCWVLWKGRKKRGSEQGSSTVLIPHESSGGLCTRLAVVGSEHQHRNSAAHITQQLLPVRTCGVLRRSWAQLSQISRRGLFGHGELVRPRGAARFRCCSLACAGPANNLNLAGLWSTCAFKLTNSDTPRLALLN